MLTRGAAQGLQPRVVGPGGDEAADGIGPGRRRQRQIAVVLPHEEEKRRQRRGRRRAYEGNHVPAQRSRARIILGLVATGSCSLGIKRAGRRRCHA